MVKKILIFAAVQALISNSFSNGSHVCDIQVNMENL